MINLFLVLDMLVYTVSLIFIALRLCVVLAFVGRLFHFVIPC